MRRLAFGIAVCLLLLVIPNGAAGQFWTGDLFTFSPDQCTSGMAMLPQIPHGLTSLKVNDNATPIIVWIHTLSHDIPSTSSSSLGKCVDHIFMHRIYTAHQLEVVHLQDSCLRYRKASLFFHSWAVFCGKLMLERTCFPVNKFETHIL